MHPNTRLALISSVISISQPSLDHVMILSPRDVLLHTDTRSVATSGQSILRSRTSPLMATIAGIKCLVVNLVNP
ncbi:hypothetical protein BDW72DRAFT_31233 [Aspergillus terricola var. indicus]